MKWPTAALGDLCEVSIGRTPARNKPEFWGPGMPWLSIADMNQGARIRATKESITSAGAKGGKLVEAGNVVLSFKLSIGKVAITEIPLYTNEAIAALCVRDNGILDRGYLLRALEFMDLKAGANRAAMGATLNLAALRALRLPFPPIAEQRRIAAILDQADAIRTKRRQARAHLDRLPELSWVDLFGAAPPVLTVEGVLASRGAMRTGPFGSQLLKEELVDDGVPVLGLDNVVSNRFQWGGGRFVTAEKYAALRRYEVYPGDVLISIMGTVGRCVVVPPNTPRCINTKHICAVTVDDSLILPEVLRAAFLWYLPARSHLARQSKGSIMAGLNMGIIKSLPLPDISMPRQIEFVRTLHAVEEARTQVERQLAADDELFASLQARAFRGEL